MQWIDRSHLLGIHNTNPKVSHNNLPKLIERFKRRQMMSWRALIYGGKNLQESSSKLHLSLFIYCQEQRNMDKYWFYPILLCKPQRVVVYIVANKSARIIWCCHLISHLRQWFCYLLNWKRSLHQETRKIEPTNIQTYAILISKHGL